MSQAMQDFLDRFHALVLPTAENESWNLLVSSQKTQTEAHETNGRTVFRADGRQL